MPLYLIANTVYYPIPDSNKYVRGTLHGELFLTKIFTLEEIKIEHSQSKYPLEACEHLHELCAKWGPRESHSGISL